jgi:hypothetical protein
VVCIPTGTFGHGILLVCYFREHERTSSEVKHSTTQSSPYHTLKKSEVGKKPSGIPLPKVHKEQAVTTTANYIDIGGQRIYTSPPDHGVQVLILNLYAY